MKNSWPNNILFWCVKDLTHLRKSASTAHSLQKQITCTVPGNSRQRNFCTPEKNEIQIVFRSVLRFIEDYPYEAHKKINYIPCGSMKGNQLLRKAHSMFGWDWGPQTIDAGIFRDIYLQGYSHARIEDIRIHQQHAKNVSVQTSITLSESVPGQKLCVELSEDGADKPLQTKLCKTNADGGQRWIL